MIILTVILIVLGIIAGAVIVYNPDSWKFVMPIFLIIVLAVFIVGIYFLRINFYLWCLLIKVKEYNCMIMDIVVLLLVFVFVASSIGICFAKKKSIDFRLFIFIDSIAIAAIFALFISITNSAGISFEKGNTIEEGNIIERFDNGILVRPDGEGTYTKLSYNVVRYSKDVKPERYIKKEYSPFLINNQKYFIGE